MANLKYIQISIDRKEKFYMQRKGCSFFLNSKRESFYPKVSVVFKM